MGGRHGHGHGRHDEPFGPRGGGFPFGWGPMGGPGGPGFPGGGRRGRRARRGDVRTAALLLLAEGPRNGYQIMQELEERSDGAWRPSAGSVYPALQMLEDEGLVRAEEQDGRRVFTLTDAGRAAVAERPADAPAPWDELSGAVDDDVAGLATEIRGALMAAGQIGRVGKPEQVAAAQKILADARRALYRLLAEDEPTEGAG